MTKRQRHRLKQLQKKADELNARYPVGTPCRYWTLTRDFPAKTGTLRHRFTVLMGHTLVGWVEGQPGCVLASHIDCHPEGVPEA